MGRKSGIHKAKRDSICPLCFRWIRKGDDYRPQNGTFIHPFCFNAYWDARKAREKLIQGDLFDVGAMGTDT